MKMAKMIFLIGSFMVVTSGSIRAVPLNITWNGGAPQYWDYSPAQGSPGFQDTIPIENLGRVAEINLAGVNSINMTWNAPAGYMYVVKPVPAGYEFTGLFFEALYESSGSGTLGLGSITSSSLSVHTIYGTSPLSGGASLGYGGLEFDASASSGSGFEPFAFNSITISADFSGTGTSETLGIESPNFDPPFPFGDIYGGFSPVAPVPPTPGNFDPSSLLTLEPLPSGSAPDATGTLTLAGFGFAGLLLMGRKRLAVDC